MELTAVSLSFIVFALSCAQAQIFFLPEVLEATDSENPYKCLCDFAHDDYDPICGSNGITYTNPLQFYCDKKCKNPNLNILYRGSCNEEPKLRNSMNDNWSESERKLKILNKCPCSISSEYNPVCGSNGITYDNPSLLLCEKRCKQSKINLMHYGLCREEEYFSDPLPFLTSAMNRCNCRYNDEQDPVCGTDGYTYPNLSAMSCVQRCINPSLQVVHYGFCIDNQKPHNYGATTCKCISSSENYEPICADNGITYDNLSLFSCAQKCLNRNLEIEYENPCRDNLYIDDRKL